MAKNNYWRNFQQYWREQLTHALLPAAGVALATFGIHDGDYHLAAGYAVPVFQFARQALEWADQRDTIGIDLSYVIGGAALGYFGAALAIGLGAV